MEVKVDVEELQRFKNSLDSYISEMEYLVEATERKTADMARKATHDQILSSMSDEVRSTCMNIKVQLESLKNGPQKKIGQKVLKYSSPPSQFKGRSR